MTKISSLLMFCNINFLGFLTIPWSNILLLVARDKPHDPWKYLKTIWGPRSRINISKGNNQLDIQTIFDYFFLYFCHFVIFYDKKFISIVVGPFSINQKWRCKNAFFSLDLGYDNNKIFTLKFSQHSSKNYKICWWPILVSGSARFITPYCIF